MSNGEAFEDQDIIEQERLHIFKVVQREREKIKSLLSIRMRFKNLWSRYGLVAKEFLPGRVVWSDKRVWWDKTPRPDSFNMAFITMLVLYQGISWYLIFFNQFEGFMKNANGSYISLILKKIRA